MTALQSGSAGLGAEREGIVTFITFVFRHARSILAPAFLAGVATVILALLLPRTYEASATLVVLSPKGLSDLKPSGLTVQGYQKLLEADAVIEEARDQLIKKGVLLPGDLFRLREELETRIFVSRFSESTTLAPMIQIVARAKTAQNAARIANTWAEVFHARVRDLMVGSTSVQVKFVDEEYPKSRERLIQLENDHLGNERDYHRRLDDLAQIWDEKLLQVKNETSNLLAAYQVQTKSLTEEFKGANNILTRREQLMALRKAYIAIQNEQAQLGLLLQQKTLQLETAHLQLGKVSAYITLRKAVSDETLWRTLIATEGKELDWKLLQDRIMLTQEINPVHRDLAARVSLLEIEERALAPRAQQLETELTRMNSGIKGVDALLRADEAQLDKLVREREAGREQLEDKRATILADLMRQRQQDLDALKSERDVHLGRLQRGVAQEKELNTELAKNYNQAILAKAQQSAEEIRLGTAAVPLDRPLPRGMLPYSLLAAASAGLVGLAIAWVRETVNNRV